MTTTAPPTEVAHDAPTTPATERPVGSLHAIATGFLMGAANLVPGLSGGTMVLIMGLYERFVGAVAEVTSLKLRRPTLVFLALFAIGIVIALGGFSKVAVWAVVNERMASFALFVGLTLGVVPELFSESRPAAAGQERQVASYGWLGFAVSVVAGFGLVVGVDAMGASSGGGGFVFLAIVGALAASSMILPGVSGSYVLLLFGVYETVIGSISLITKEPGEAIGVLGPVAVGVAVGIGAFANLLKFLLERASRPTHAALLGLVLGSVVGLWPFENLVHPELAVRDQRKAIEAIVLEGATYDEVRAEREVDWEDARFDELVAPFAEVTSKTELKLASQRTLGFTPSPLQIALSLGLVLIGFFLTRMLARVGAKHAAAD